nr:methyltransferase domain-containing protein [Desulfocapsaceae bacterium]
LNNIGVILSEKGEVKTAVSYLEKSYSMDPYNNETLYNLAGLYNCIDEPAEAQKMLESLLELEPGHASAQHMLAAVSGKTTDTAPSAYIEETFDRYANRFDIHLQKSLCYDTPSTLAAMLVELEPDRRFQSCRDLGCGTGLSGEAFKDCTESLIGVDLSSRMLAKAGEKGIYTKLHCNEVYTFLKDNDDKYDLVLVADVFIYLGRLDVFFRDMTQCTKKDAIIACSIERHDGSEDFILRSSGRYAHKPAYLKTMAENYGFSIIRHKDHGIRKENDKWIRGDLYIIGMSF